MAERPFSSKIVYLDMSGEAFRPGAANLPFNVRTLLSFRRKEGIGIFPDQDHGETKITGGNPSYPSRENPDCLLIRALMYLQHLQV